MRSVVVAAVAAGVLVSGCVSTKNVPLKADRLSSISGQPVGYTDRPIPDFSAMKAGNVAAGSLFGPIGAVAMASLAISDGNALVKEHQIADPADTIAQALTGALASSASASPLAEPIAIQSEKPEDIAATASAAKYVIDVRTTTWGMIYFPTDWAHYGVMYGAKLRLIDTSSKNVVAEGFCYVKPEKGEAGKAPTFDQMTADGAAQLKTLLAAAGERCLTQFKTETLKL